jgi:hypothetical protein
MRILLSRSTISVLGKLLTYGAEINDIVRLESKFFLDIGHEVDRGAVQIDKHELTVTVDNLGETAWSETIAGGTDTHRQEVGEM